MIPSRGLVMNSQDFCGQVEIFMMTARNFFDVDSKILWWKVEAFMMRDQDFAMKKRQDFNENNKSDRCGWSRSRTVTY